MHARSITMFLVTAVVALVAALALAACSSSTASSSSASSAASSGASSSAASSASSQATPQGTADVVTIELDYSAGTGYEWVYSIEPDGVVAQVSVTTENLAKDKNVTGGPLRDVYTFRAVAPGEAVITFTLQRGWEKDEAAEEQVYAFTVTDDLKMVLNPYKSTFDREPTWGSVS